MATEVSFAAADRVHTLRRKLDALELLTELVGGQPELLGQSLAKAQRTWLDQAAQEAEAVL